MRISTAVGGRISSSTRRRIVAKRTGLMPKANEHRATLYMERLSDETSVRLTEHTPTALVGPKGPW